MKTKLLKLLRREAEEYTDKNIWLRGYPRDVKDYLRRDYIFRRVAELKRKRK